MLKANKEKGFTIIEVVLVLAIAGLIFLVVFLALPALQRSQRDTARRQDVGKVVSAVQSYMSDNKSVLPITDTGFSGYAGSLAQASSNMIWVTDGSTTVSATASDAAKLKSDQITIVTGRNCDDEVNARKAAVMIRLEASDAKYCESV